MSERRKKIIRDAGTYSFAAFAKEFVTFAASILTRLFLGPLQMGVWGVLQIILTYSGYAALGTIHGGIREIPLYIGKKEPAKSDEIKNLIFSFSVLTSSTVAIGLLIYACIFKNSLRSEIFYGLLFVSVLVILQQINNMLIGFLRAYKYFGAASKQMILSSIVNAAFIAVLAYQFKIYGFLLAMGLTLVFNISYILKKQRFSLRWYIAWSKIGRLMSYGFPLLIVAALDTFLLSVDKIMIASFLGLEDLGLYSIAFLAWRYVTTFPNAISVISIPNYQERFGENEKREDLKSYVSKSLLGLTTIVPLLIAFAWFFGPYFVNLVLPKFSAGIPALKYLVIGTFFVGPIQACEHFIIAIKKHFLILPISGLTLLFAILCNWIAIWLGYGILGIAIATTCVTCLNFLGLFALVGKYLYSLRELWAGYSKIAGKYIYLIFLLLMLQKIDISQRYVFPDIVLQFLCFLLLFSPFLIHLNRELQMWSMMKSYVKERWFDSDV